jgi:hypothetical protein
MSSPETNLNCNKPTVLIHCATKNQDTPAEVAKDNMDQTVLGVREIYNLMMTRLLDVKSILDGDELAV